MPAALNPIAFVSQLIVLALVLLPIILGFTLVRTDANRHGQPGLLWAVLTIPFSWIAVLVYLIVRALAVRPNVQ